jgi:hypothetical protein
MQLIISMTIEEKEEGEEEEKGEQYIYRRNRGDDGSKFFRCV